MRDKDTYFCEPLYYVISKGAWQITDKMPIVALTFIMPMMIDTMHVTVLFDYSDYLAAMSYKVTSTHNMCTVYVMYKYMQCSECIHAYCTKYME